MSKFVEYYDSSDEDNDKNEAPDHFEANSSVGEYEDDYEYADQPFRGETYISSEQEWRDPNDSRVRVGKATTTSNQLLTSVIDGSEHLTGIARKVALIDMSDDQRAQEKLNQVINRLNLSDSDKKDIERIYGKIGNIFLNAEALCSAFVCLFKKKAVSSMAKDMKISEFDIIRYMKLIEKHN
jgi:hypothetical protein